MWNVRNGRLVIPVPKKGACRMCGEIHGPQEPHNLNSVIYQHKFRRKHGRYPTWEDALSGCSEKTRERYLKKMERE